MPRPSARRQEYDRLVARALKKQGTSTMAAFDPTEYPPIPGLEGPFRFRKSGAILYYDPRAGKYYDAKADLYVDSKMAEGALSEAMVSVSGLQGAKDRARVQGGPLRAPHYTAPWKVVADEVSMARGGVLYLDEIEGFAKQFIEMLVGELRGVHDVDLVVSPKPTHPLAAARWERHMAILRRYVSEKFMGTIGPGGKVTPPKKKRSGLVPVSQGAKDDVTRQLPYAERQRKAREAAKKKQLAASLILKVAPGEELVEGASDKFAEHVRRAILALPSVSNYPVLRKLMFQMIKYDGAAGTPYPARSIARDLKSWMDRNTFILSNARTAQAHLLAALDAAYSLPESVKGKPAAHGRTPKQTSRATGKAAAHPERDRRNKGRGSRPQAGGGRKYRRKGSSSEYGHAKSQRKEPLVASLLTLDGPPGVLADSAAWGRFRHGAAPLDVARENLAEAAYGYVTIYSGGGHRGPYPDLETAKAAALAGIDWSKMGRDNWVAVIQGSIPGGVWVGRMMRGGGNPWLPAARDPDARRIAKQWSLKVLP